MTIEEAQLADISAAIAWSLSAIVMVLGFRSKALWGNIVTGFIVGGVAIASLVEALFTMERLAKRVQRQANPELWIVSHTPFLSIAVVTVALAFAAILLSLNGLRSDQHRFWAAWLLNAPSVSLAVVGLWATSFW